LHCYSSIIPNRSSTFDINRLCILISFFLQKWDLVKTLFMLFKCTLQLTLSIIANRTLYHIIGFVRHIRLMGNLWPPIAHSRRDAMQEGEVEDTEPWRALPACLIPRRMCPRFPWKAKHIWHTCETFSNCLIYHVLNEIYCEYSKLN